MGDTYSNNLYAGWATQPKRIEYPSVIVRMREDTSSLWRDYCAIARAFGNGSKEADVAYEAYRFMDETLSKNEREYVADPDKYMAMYDDADNRESYAGYQGRE